MSRGSGRTVRGGEACGVFFSVASGLAPIGPVLRYRAALRYFLFGSVGHDHRQGSPCLPPVRSEASVSVSSDRSPIAHAEDHSSRVVSE